MQLFQNKIQDFPEIAPSLICADLCNLERDVKRIELLGCNMLHVDIIDGYFSPSMPIGLDTVRQLRRKTKMVFDTHVMAENNNFFISELLDLGSERICFQLESEPTPGPLLQKIRACGAQAGIALAPTTPISSLEYLIKECDYVLLMQINPGYASLPDTKAVPYMSSKIAVLKELIERSNSEATISIDGRVGFDCMTDLLSAGVSTFISGTQGLFCRCESWENNWSHMLRLLGKETGI